MGTFFLSLVTSATSFLIAADRHWRLMWIQAASVAVDAVLIILALRAGYGIAGAAGATAITYVVYATAALWLAFHHTGFTPARILREWVHLYAPYVYVAAVVLALEFRLPLAGVNTWLAVALREVLLLAALIPAAFVWERTTRGVSAVLTVLRSARR
jgi:O-antigen/teichoic acid export membrane protein